MTPHRAYRLLLLLAVAGLSSWQACADEAHGLVTIGVQRAFANAMTHIAITETLDGKNVDWMEHVSDEQYRK